jgi:hypothetical protein
MSTAFFWQKRGFAGTIDEQRAKMVNRLIALCRENKKPVPPSFASVAQRYSRSNHAVLAILSRL